MTGHHGGRLRQAATTHGRPLADWLDLSTGIAPWSWPVPSVPEAVWARLPEPEDGLLEAAAAYYGRPVDRLLAVPGSQYAIRALPGLFKPGRVAIPAIGYTEHARAWAAAGHTLWRYETLDALMDALDGLDHAVVLAPNNPTGAMPTSAQLADAARRLGPGRLIVDAAFLDCRATPPDLPETALVLRSVGKFFGLAGLRLGFVHGSTSCLDALAEPIQPWGVSHPARWIGRAALADTAWQARQRDRITEGAAWLVDQLTRAVPAARAHSGSLFVTLFFERTGIASTLHDQLAREGVFTRLGDDGHWLRFGLVRPVDRPRLVAALAEIDPS